MALAPYTPPTVQDAPATTTPLSAANIMSWLSGAGTHADALSTIVEARRVHVWQQTGVSANGSTDDTTAVQALINASNTPTIFDFGDSRHNYVISSLVVKSNQAFVGRNAIMTHKAGSTEAIFTYKDWTPPRTLVTNVHFEGLIFQGEVSVAAETERCAVYIVSGHRITLRDLVAYDFKSAAYHCQDCGDVTYDNLAAYRCSNLSGRNAIEILGTSSGTWADTADVAVEWTIRNCKADLAGAVGGGAGGICVVANDAQNIRAHVDGNWAYNCLNFAGIVAEAGYARYISITGNKAFACKTGVYMIDTQSTHGTTVVIDRVNIANNIVDAKNVTTNTPTDGVVSVSPGADLPGAVGMDLQPSHSTVRGNIVRSTSDGIKLRGNSTTTVRATANVVSSNQVTMANTNAALSVFGMSFSTVTDVVIAENHVEREAAATMKDAYYLSDVAGVSWEGNSSRNAGRNAIRIAGTVSLASFNGGTHIDPCSNEVANGIDITATGCTDIHFGGGMTVKDTRGAGAQMTNGVNLSASIANSSIGEMSIMGFVTSAINGNTNVAVDQLRVHTEDKTPKTFGQNTHRRGRNNAAPTTAGWSSGDRIENTSSAAGVPVGWGCSASGNPGTWRILGVIPGVATVATDADFTLTFVTDKPTQLHTGTLTANRAVTLSTSGAYEGAKFRITRTGAGAFNLNVGTGPLKALVTNSWCDVEYDGSAWKLTGYGTL